MSKKAKVDPKVSTALTLLEVDKDNAIFCTSRMVSEKFEVEHNKVIRAIARLIAKSGNIEPDKLSGSTNQVKSVFIPYEDSYQGNFFTAYRMNKFGFMMLSMRFQTNLAFMWQEKFIEAFFILEDSMNRLHLDTRGIGKILHREKTDEEKLFIEYAKAQGSKNADKYYIALAVMENNSLFEFEYKPKNARDVMTVEQLSTVMVADKVLRKSLTEGMNMRLPYKDVFQLAKKNIEMLTSLSGKGKITLTQIPYNKALT